MYVIIQNGIIIAERIEVFATFFLDGVAVEPAAEDGQVNALLIADHAGLTVVVLRAEAEGEHVGEGTGGIDDIAVWVVGVLRDDAPSLGDIQDNVAVVVVAGNVEHAVHRDGKQSLNSTRALLRAGLVRAPEILERAGRAVGELDPFEDDVVAVPDKRVRLLRLPFVCPDRRRGRRRNAGIEPLDGLADSPVAVVVGVCFDDVVSSVGVGVRGEAVAGGGVDIGGNGRDARCPSLRRDGGSPCLGDTGEGVVGVVGGFAGGFRGEEDTMDIERPIAKTLDLGIFIACDIPGFRECRSTLVYFVPGPHGFPLFSSCQIKCHPR